VQILKLAVQSPTGRCCRRIGAFAARLFTPYANQSGTEWVGQEEKHNDTGQLKGQEVSAGIGIIVEEYKMSGRKKQAADNGMKRNPEAA